METGTQGTNAYLTTTGIGQGGLLDYPNSGGTSQWNLPSTSDPRPGCHANAHYFECRHESYCYCGKTARVDVGQGL